MTTDSNQLNPSGLRIVLVLQGGGALGAYQAGVYQALHEHDLAPDWVVGTSIGAINAALLAGNSKENRLTRLRQFWERVSHRDNIDMNLVSDQQRRSNIWLATLDTVLRGVPGFFKPRMFSLFAAGMAVKPEEASYYDTGDLARTLDELVDFDYLNAPGGMRLTVNALKVKCGSLAQFDSSERPIGIDHIRASGALPPGFPAVRLDDGELYWDGGLYSNTPLETVLDDLPHVDTLVFMVDLWSADGPEPTTLDEVQTRQKDVMFASRSKRHIEDYVTTHQMQAKLRELYAALPEREKQLQEAELKALGCDSTMHIVRLPYAGRDWHMAAKDINFSKGSIEWRWEQGYQDGLRAVKAAGWLAFVTEDTPLVVHELPPYERNAA